MKKILFTLSLVPSLMLQAQSKMPKDKISLGLNANTGFVSGELPKNRLGSGLGIFVNYKINSIFSVGLQYNAMHYLGGADQLKSYDNSDISHNFEGYLKNINFSSNSSQIAFIVGCDFTPDWMQNKGMEFKLIGGIGMSRFNSILTYLDSRPKHFGSQNPNLGAKITETYEGSHYFVPVGFGLGYKVAPRLNLNLQGTYNFTQTDDIDALNSVYFYPKGNPYDRFLNINVGCGYLF